MHIKVLKQFHYSSPHRILKQGPIWILISEQPPHYSSYLHSWLPFDCLYTIYRWGGCDWGWKRSFYLLHSSWANCTVLLGKHFMTRERDTQYALQSDSHVTQFNSVKYIIATTEPTHCQHQCFMWDPPTTHQTFLGIIIFIQAIVSDRKGWFDNCSSLLEGTYSCHELQQRQADRETDIRKLTSLSSKCLVRRA